MRQLVSRYLNNGISRREFIRNLTGLGLTATAVAAILETVERVEYPAGKANAVSEKTVTGTGGELLVAQARAAEVEYLFTNPGSFEVGFFDAVVDDPQIHLIEALARRRRDLDGRWLSQGQRQAGDGERACDRRYRADGRPTLQRLPRRIGAGDHGRIQ